MTASSLPPPPVPSVYHCPTDDYSIIPDPVVLGQDPAQTCAFLAYLRDCMERRIHVHWEGRLAGPVDVSSLYHLEPPTTLLGGPPRAAAAAWRREHRYGACYYRRGPGFVLVKDARDALETTSYVLEEEALTKTFLKCLAPTRLTTLCAAGQEAVRELSAERLILVIDGLAVALPFRMKRWPIPFWAI